jgi:hypothetical protein
MWQLIAQKWIKTGLPISSAVLALPFTHSVAPFSSGIGVPVRSGISTKLLSEIQQLGLTIPNHSTALITG